MKVFFIIPDLTLGGAERVFATLLKFWNRSLDEVTLVVLRKEGPYFAMLPPDLRVIDLSSSRLLTALPRLVKLLRKEKPQVVLSTQAHLNAAIGLLRFLLPKQIICVGRETSMPSQARGLKKTSWIKETLYKRGYRQLSGVICPSAVVSRELTADYHIDSKRLPVIPNPVDVEGIRKSSELEIPELVKNYLSQQDEETKFIAGVGRLEKVKGFDYLIDALVLLPSAYKLILIGEGKERAVLEKKVQDLNLEKRVLFSGFLPNPYGALRCCQVFVLSSRYEGFPNVVLESLVLGIPTVASRCPGGVVEILEEGVTGLFAQPENPSALAKSIEQLFKLNLNPEVLKQHAQNRYGGFAIAEKYRRALEERLNEKA